MVRRRNTGCAGSQITRGAQGGSAGGIRDNARRCVLLNGLAPAWRSANELTPRCYLGPASQCDSSSNRRRRGSHDASSGDAGDDSARLAQ